MEHYDGEFYTLRLFSPIEGEIYSLNSTEEGIHLTAYEMENYSSFIRDHMEGVGLLGKRNQKLMTYFNNAKNARDKDPGTRWRTYGFSWK